MEQNFSVNALSPLALAFVGDAVWEVFARKHCLNKGVRKPAELHKTCTRYVSAKAQAKLLEWLYPQLSEKEQEIVRRGRNAKSNHVRKNVDVIVYRYSTGFEALIGYLSGIGDEERLEELITQSLEWIDSK
jgi:ribonuclease III family protein